MAPLQFSRKTEDLPRRSPILVTAPVALPRKRLERAAGHRWGTQSLIPLGEALTESDWVMRLQRSVGRGGRAPPHPPAFGTGLVSKRK